MAAIPFFSNKLVASVVSPDEFSPETLAMVAGDIDRVLVLVRLHGGNDGLSTVVPMDQYANLINPKVRKDLMIAENKLLKINGGLQALHPAMTDMHQLFNDGKMTIVQGVANSANVFSHFHGIDQWDTASDNTKTYSNGWMGRYIEKTYCSAPLNYPNQFMNDPFAIEVGAAPSLSLRGSGGSLGQSVNAGFDGKITLLQDVYNNDDLSLNMKNELAFLRVQQGNTNDYGKKIVKAWDLGNSSSISYPATVISNSNNLGITPTTLGQQLRIVARLLRGGLKTRIFVVNIGNFDTHANQGTENGAQALLLKDLSNAIGAFQKDLDASNLSDRVMGMTYSEFGRRVQQNDKGSTEHGLGAPMFIFGNKASGKVIGNNYVVNPSTLTAGTTVDMQYDYRQVYKTILSDWFSICNTDSLDILKKDVPKVNDIFKTNTQLPTVSCGPLVEPSDKACIVNVKEITGDDHDLYARIQPNPNHGTFSINPSHGFDFSKSITIYVTDMQGRSLYKEQKMYTEGETIHLDLQLENGMYIVSVQNAAFRLNQKIVVQN